MARAKPHMSGMELVCGAVHRSKSSVEVAPDEGNPVGGELLIAGLRVGCYVHVHFGFHDL